VGLTDRTVRHHERRWRVKQSIAVVGAGGRAGRAVVAEAARRGPRVTAIGRHPADPTDLATRADVVATDAVGLEKVVAGHDAIVGASDG
jgi:uncharacterized protein